MENLHQYIEALIFSSEQAVSADEIASCLSSFFSVELSAEEITKEVLELEAKYNKSEFFFELAYINNGYQFLTKKEFAPALAILLQHKSKKKLSTAAMETLAIIAYKQPVTKPEIEQIRGVNSDYSVQRLLEKDLIQIDGKSDQVGKPLIYSTSRNFMDYFKLNSLEQLPQLKDLTQEEKLGSVAE